MKQAEHFQVNWFGITSVVFAGILDLCPRTATPTAFGLRRCCARWNPELCNSCGTYCCVARVEMVVPGFTRAIVWMDADLVC
jgi:hypothetical protein